MSNDEWMPKPPNRAAHPDRLHVLGTLFGLEPARVEFCRTLEIGCRDGGHLLGLASAYSNATFVGLDVSPGAIEAATRTAERAGLANVRFGEVEGIAALDGPFDYVVVEYAALRAEGPGATLRDVRRLLSEQGLAVIEYACRPGARLEEVVHSMLRRHVRGVKVRSTRVSQAKALLRVLLDAPAGGRGIELLRPEVERAARLSDVELARVLGDESEALLFGEFIRKVGEERLAFVSEATLADGSIRRFSGEPRAWLAGTETKLEREQYIDFFSGRRRRQSVVCRAEAVVAEAPSPERALRLFAMSPAVATGAPEERRIRLPGGAEVRLEDPILYELVRICGAEWPRVLPCSAALGAVSKITSLSTVSEQSFAERLLGAVELDLVELRSHEVPTLSKVPERPFVPLLARVESELGRPLTSLLHFPVALRSPLARRLVPLLDGTHGLDEIEALLSAGSPRIGKDAIVAELRVLARAGVLCAEREGAAK